MMEFLWFVFKRINTVPLYRTNTILKYVLGIFSPMRHFQVGGFLYVKHRGKTFHFAVVNV